MHEAHTIQPGRQAHHTVSIRKLQSGRWQATVDYGYDWQGKRDSIGKPWSNLPPRAHNRQGRSTIELKRYSYITRLRYKELFELGERQQQIVSPQVKYSRNPSQKLKNSQKNIKLLLDYILSIVYNSDNKKGGGYEFYRKDLAILSHSFAEVQTSE